jgi:hypothetical protein
MAVSFSSSMRVEIRSAPPANVIDMTSQQSLAWPGMPQGDQIWHPDHPSLQNKAEWTDLLFAQGLYSGATQQATAAQVTLTQANAQWVDEMTGAQSLAELRQQSVTIANDHLARIAVWLEDLPAAFEPVP